MNFFLLKLILQILKILTLDKIANAFVKIQLNGLFIFETLDDLIFREQCHKPV